MIAEKFPDNSPDDEQDSFNNTVAVFIFYINEISAFRKFIDFSGRYMPVVCATRTAVPTDRRSYGINNRNGCC